MKYIWIILMVFLLIRSIKLLARQAGTGTSDGSNARVPTPAYGEKTWAESPPASEPGANGTYAYLPENQAGWPGHTPAGETEPRRAPENLAGVRRLERDEKAAPSPERCRRGDEPMPVAGMVFPGELLKGMVWLQILDSRGGLQAKKRYRR